MKIRQPHIIYDRLYGQLQISPVEWQLFQTPELARLRHISLSAVPTWSLPTGICASKFEHSVGVTHLAKIVGKNPLFSQSAANLYLAALLHDTGTPPFSHISEHFLEAILSRNHEEFVMETIRSPQLKKAISDFGGTLDDIYKLITGTLKPLSDLINGSVDIDNLDNSLRWGLSMGVLPKKTYSPAQLALYYTRHDRQIAFAPGVTRQIRAWEKTRSLVYKMVYSPANLAPAVMLLRALYFATQAGQLHKSYFLLTDAEALTYLTQRCNRVTQNLIISMYEWRFYLPAFSLVTDSASPRFIKTVRDIIANEKQADELARRLHCPPELVCVHTSRDRTYKEVHLPLVKKSQSAGYYQPANKLTWRVDVFVHPKLTEKIPQIKYFIQEQYQNI